MIINIQQVIVKAMSNLRLLDSQENQEEIQAYINSAAKHRLNASNTKTVQCTEVPVECNKAQLPDNYTDLYFFRLFPNNSCCCGGGEFAETCEDTKKLGLPPNYYCRNGCPELYYYDKSVVLQQGCDWYENYFYIQNNTIILPEKTTATSIKVYYDGFNTDANGLMLIDEECEETLAFYASWQYALVYIERYTPEQRAEWKRLYIAGSANLRGKKMIREFKLSKPQISLIANSILINKRYGGMGR